jgi:hypothetical protein
VYSLPRCFVRIGPYATPARTAPAAWNRIDFVHSNGGE